MVGPDQTHGFSTLTPVSISNARLARTDTSSAAACESHVFHTALLRSSPSCSLATHRFCIHGCLVEHTCTRTNTSRAHILANMRPWLSLTRPLAASNIEQLLHRTRGLASSFHGRFFSSEVAPEREQMHYDVCIVGAGPAGLSAAIKLKQVSRCAGASLAL
jgi:hypothetical protein